LALAVLVLLFERPMHPYEMAATMRERHKEESIKLRYGSLYTVIELLQREGYIVPTETVREGRRPERTVFALTPIGEVEMRDWLADLLANPVKEFPRFEAALSLVPALPPEQVIDLLSARVTRLDHEIKRLQSALASIAGKVPRLFTIEADYYGAMLAAERRFVALFVDEIRTGTIEGLAFWRDFHAARLAATASGSKPADRPAMEPSPNPPAPKAKRKEST
jgi:DNA-binding PadR family transcriptional regulator